MRIRVNIVASFPKPSTRNAAGHRRIVVQRPGVPNLRRPVVARGHDSRPVRTERCRRDDTNVSLQGENISTTTGVPDLYRAIPAPGHETRPFRAKLCRMDAVGVAPERDELGSALRVPDFRSVVPTPGHDAQSRPN